MEVEISFQQHTYCSGLWNSRTASCLRISSIVILLLGLKIRIFYSRSMQSGLRFLKRIAALLLLETFISLIRDRDISEWMESMSSSEGQPVNAHIFSSWSMVQLPANRGFWANIQQMMQPKLQMSAGVEQLLEPSSTSGERYHLVATPSVRTGESWWRASERTSPKSQSLMVQLELTSTLEGLRSLWMMRAEWRYLRALAIWQTMNLMWMSLRMPSPITLCRSASMYSNTRYTSLLFSARIVSYSFIMLPCYTCRRISISRYVRCASVACWKASNIFFRAQIFFVPFSSTFQTWPYAPEPIFLRTVKRFSTCASMKLAFDCEDML